jgi:hypothetical protein
MLKTIKTKTGPLLLGAVLLAGLTGCAGSDKAMAEDKMMTGNATAMSPPGGNYKAVSSLVPLPDHIPGIGSLYVDPKTLPAGPFASYDKTGKLVSTVYMIPLEDMQAQKKFSGLDVAGGTAASVDMYYNAGHPGVAEPHYHIVIWHVDPATAQVQ